MSLTRSSGNLAFLKIKPACVKAHIFTPSITCISVLVSLPPSIVWQPLSTHYYSGLF